MRSNPISVFDRRPHHSGRRNVRSVRHAKSNDYVPSSSSLGRGAGNSNACNAVRHQRKHCRQSSLKGRF